MPLRPAIATHTCKEAPLHQPRDPSPSLTPIHHYKKTQPWNRRGGKQQKNLKQKQKDIALSQSNRLGIFDGTLEEPRLKGYTMPDVQLLLFSAIQDPRRMERKRGTEKYPTVAT